MAEICALLGILSISLSCAILWMLILFIVELKWCATFLEACFLHVDEIYLVDEGFILLSCGIGKKISAFVGIFYLFHVTFV